MANMACAIALAALAVASAVVAGLTVAAGKLKTDDMRAAEDQEQMEFLENYMEGKKKKKDEPAAGKQ